MYFGTGRVEAVDIEWGEIDVICDLVVIIITEYRVTQGWISGLLHAFIRWIIVFGMTWHWLAWRWCV